MNFQMHAYLHEISTDLFNNMKIRNLAKLWLEISLIRDKHVRPSIKIYRNKVIPMNFVTQLMIMFTLSG